FRKVLGSVPQTFFVDVAQGDDVLPAPGDAMQVAAPLAADSDKRHVQLFVGRFTLPARQSSSCPEADACQGALLDEGTTIGTDRHELHSWRVARLKTGLHRPSSHR